VEIINTSVAATTEADIAPKITKLIAKSLLFTIVE